MLNRPINLKGKLLATTLYIGLLLIFWALKFPCLFQSIFGLPCPGCGMSRALFALLRLDIVSAFKFHPMFWSVPIFYFYFIFDFNVTGNKYIDKAVIFLIALGFLINWLLKIITFLL